jgi:centromeric protein E
MQGFNGSILTYGQTSSGKTYTMMGDECAKGVIELTVDDIFSEIESCSDKSFNLSVSFIEIYNEKIFDLLVERKHELRIFESQGEATTNQVQIAIRSKRDFLRILRSGSRNKHVASTALNENSSRSHTILTINIESTDANAEIKSSKLFLVDLAGSEKPDATKNSFHEGLHINKSLLALGKIIRQLTEKNVNVKNLRYRESVLTRLLSSSLGGNSFTSIICTASLVSLDETFYTIW